MNFGIDKKGYNIIEVDEYLRRVTRNYEETLAEQRQRIVELKDALKESEKNVKAYKEKGSLVSKAIYNAVAKADEIERLTQLKYNQEIQQLKVFHEKWMSYYNKILEKYPLDDDLQAASKFNIKMKSILSRTVSASDEQSEPETAAKMLEKNYETESGRLKEKRIGYITVKTYDNQSENDDKLLEEMIPGGDLNSPILSGEFDPVERINKYFTAEKTRQKTSSTDASSDTAAASDTTEQNMQASHSNRSSGANEFADRSASGFSFQTTLNPKEDLAQIMKDLGLLLDER